MWYRLGGGVNATIYLVKDGLEGSPDTQYIEKIVQAPSNGIDLSRRPHNIKREAELLSRAQHDNVIEILQYNYSYDSGHILTLPHLSFTLTDLDLHAQSDQDFGFLVKSVAGQCTAGIAHLHSLGIAHRDINPHNIMFDWNGGIKVIDLGIAWSAESGERREDGSMVTEVGTGSYRAPELLFGDTSYDPFATDLWALGATIAGLLLPCPPINTAVHIIYPLEDSDDDSDGDSDSPSTTLFDSRYGDLGLSASIFRIMGSPTPETWPDFTRLPDAGKVDFEHFTPRPLSFVLTEVTRFPDQHEQRMTLVWIGALLRLDPAARVTAEAALSHPWMTEGPIVLPEGHAARRGNAERFVAILKGRSMSVLVGEELKRAEKRLSDIISGPNVHTTSQGYGLCIL